MKMYNEYNFGNPKSAESFMSYRHDNLSRCIVCRFKYDLSDLRRDKIGNFVCKFCIKHKGVLSVQNHTR